MLLQDDWDVLVVGAGPAGSRAATASAAAGARTLLIDAKVRIGEQPHCGEFVPLQLFVECGLDRVSVIQAVDDMETVVVDLNSPEGEVLRPGSVQRSPGFLIDRVCFDRQLAREAAIAGAVVLSGARLKGRKDDGWIIGIDGQEIQIRARFVVAADGAVSTVASVLSLEQPDFLRGVQVEAPLARPLNKTMVFLSRDLKGGYGWLFPKGNVANVGLGVGSEPDLSPRKLLERLIYMLMSRGLIRPGRLSQTAGLIPVSGMRPTLVFNNVVFCGDAAGLTHPITGAGVPQAVSSGDLAGRAIAAALKTRDRAHLKSYENEVTGRYRGVLDHALAKRRLMMAGWHEADFEKASKQWWIGFKEYRRRVR
ncbi:MAG: geranylgeranyl reductase family protein [Thermodesulfobacteriota bacterium]